jgi:hypothetical protein
MVLRKSMIRERQHTRESANTLLRHWSVSIIIKRIRSFENMKNRCHPTRIHQISTFLIEYSIGRLFLSSLPNVPSEFNYRYVMCVSLDHTNILQHYFSSIQVGEMYQILRVRTCSEGIIKDSSTQSRLFSIRSQQVVVQKQSDTIATIVAITTIDTATDRWKQCGQKCKPSR